MADQQHDEDQAEQELPPEVLEQMQAARDTLAKSIARLEGTGYLMPAEEDARTALSADGLTRLVDLVTVFVAQSSGDEMPPAFKMAHDVGAVFYLCLTSIMIADDRRIGNPELQRQAINQLRRAARDHK